MGYGILELLRKDQQENKKKLEVVMELGEENKKILHNLNNKHQATHQLQVIKVLAMDRGILKLYQKVQQENRIKLKVQENNKKITRVVIGLEKVQQSVAESSLIHLIN